MSHPFMTTRLVEFVDTDAGRIMHFTSFLKYMEQAEHEMLRSLGLSVFTEVDEQTVSWPRVSTSFEYKRPAVFEDLLTIRMGIQRLGNKSVTYAAEFWHDEHLLATGRIVAACCRVEEGTPPVAIPIPSSIAEKLQAMLIQIS